MRNNSSPPPSPPQDNPYSESSHAKEHDAIAHQPPTAAEVRSAVKNASHTGLTIIVIWTAYITILFCIVGLGGAYGVATHKFFASVFSIKNGTGSSLMLVSFLAGAPCAIGALCAYASSQAKRALRAGDGDVGVLSAGFIAFLSASFFAFAGGAILGEGVICVLMALPLFIGMAVLGAIIIVIAGLFGPKTKNTVLGLMLLFPFAAAPFEQRATPENTYQYVNRSVFIAASPQAIWQHINFPLDIKPAELKSGFAYKIGVPYPIEARTIEPRVGGTRQLQWERGVKFEEVITAWDENRHVAWKYRFDKESFPEGSLDDHIVIGGRYFDLEDTSYTLTPEVGGTRLSIAVKTRVTTTFNWYAGAWAEFLIDDTAQAILRFYKNRAERTGQNGALKLQEL